MGVKEWATIENVENNISKYFKEITPMNLTLNAYKCDDHLKLGERRHIGNEDTLRRVYIGTRLKGKYKGVQCLIIADDCVRIYRPLTEGNWIYE